MEEETRLAQLKKEFPDYDKIGLPSGTVFIGMSSDCVDTRTHTSPHKHATHRNTHTLSTGGCSAGPRLRPGDCLCSQGPFLSPVRWLVSCWTTLSGWVGGGGGGC